MKKIQLSDGQASTISRKQLKNETISLLKEIETKCIESGLSYVEINKALHLADEELYTSVINGSLQKSK